MVSSEHPLGLAGATPTAEPLAGEARPENDGRPPDQSSAAAQVALAEALNAVRTSMADTVERVYSDLGEKNTSGRMLILMGFSLFIVAGAIRTWQWKIYAGIVSELASQENEFSINTVNVMDDIMFYASCLGGAGLVACGLLVQFFLVWRAGAASDHLNNATLEMLEKLRANGNLPGRDS